MGLGASEVAGKPTTVDAYLAEVPVDARAAFEDLRRTVRAVAPDTAESISYDMPTFKYRGKRLVYFGAWKGHCALYGLNFAGHLDALSAYHVEKGTLRFLPSDPPPDALIKLLLTERIAEIETAAAPKRRPRAE